MIELTIANQTLGGIQAKIADDLESVELVGLGKAKVTYHVRSGFLGQIATNPCDLSNYAILRDSCVKVGRIVTNPYDLKTNYAILRLFKKLNVPVNPRIKLHKEAGRVIYIGESHVFGISFGLTDEQKDTIAITYRAVIHTFVDDFMKGKIKIVIDYAGTDFPHPVLSVVDVKGLSHGLRLWDLFYDVVRTYHLYYALTWLPTEKLVSGTDVTADVIEKILLAEREMKQLDTKLERYGFNLKGVNGRGIPTADVPPSTKPQNHLT